MLHVIDFLLIGVFLFIAYQDFRFRAISIWTLPLMAILTIFINIHVITPTVLLTNTLVNLLVFAVQLGAVTLYFSIRHKKVMNIVNRYLGLGDIFFISVMAIMFSPVQFIVFLVFGLIVVGVSYAVMRLLMTNISSAIPLAGGLSVMLSLLWGAKLCFNIGQVYANPVIEHLIIR